MNESIDLTKILKNCPRGKKLYSLIHGEVQFGYIDHSDYPITVELSDSLEAGFTKDGRLYIGYDSECVLLPSKDQRDWSKFTAPWYKKEKFDPKTLQPFDKVLVKIGSFWQIELFSHIWKNSIEYQYQCARSRYDICIPYNDDTKHLVGTSNEAPEYYRYWED